MLHYSNPNTSYTFTMVNSKCKYWRMRMVMPLGVVTARVGIVDYNGNVLLDLMSEPVDLITNYRKEITGLDSSYLQKAKPFEETKRLVSEMIEVGI